MNDADFKEAMFLLGELNEVELCGVIIALVEQLVPIDGLELRTIKHLIEVTKKQRMKV